MAECSYPDCEASRHIEDTKKDVVKIFDLFDSKEKEFRFEMKQAKDDMKDVVTEVKKTLNKLIWSFLCFLGFTSLALIGIIWANLSKIISP